MSQDLPPQGGYAPVQFKRNLPSRGFRPIYYGAGMVAIMAYGFYEVRKGIKEQRELVREKVWARIHLTPVLQAEADRDTVRRQLALDAREKELMKDVKDWKYGSVYHTKRYMRPNYVYTPSEGFDR